MSHAITRRIVGFVLVLALIASGGAFAAVPESGPGLQEAVAARFAGLAGLWDWLTGLWAENGCMLDPGGCTDGGGDEPAAGAQGDNGCGADPNGAPCTGG